MDVALHIPHWLIVAAEFGGVFIAGLCCGLWVAGNMVANGVGRAFGWYY